MWVHSVLQRRYIALLSPPPSSCQSYQSSMIGVKINFGRCFLELWSTWPAAGTGVATRISHLLNCSGIILRVCLFLTGYVCFPAFRLRMCSRYFASCVSASKSARQPHARAFCWRSGWCLWLKYRLMIQFDTYVDGWYTSFMTDTSIIVCFYWW